MDLATLVARLEWSSEVLYALGIRSTGLRESRVVQGRSNGVVDADTCASVMLRTPFG